MILVYTGEGKGKTSACLGQTLRALGHGKRVAFAQFIKRDGCAGEQVLLRQLLGDNFRAQGLGFVKNVPDKAPHIQAAKDLFSWCLDMLPTVWLLVLDEILYALHYELLTANDLHTLLERAGHLHTHLLLSGRYLPTWLERVSDLVTTLSQTKHPFSLGKKALPGLDC